TTSIDIMGLQAAYANLHTDQERDYFMQRYHDVISSFGGKTSYDADNRPLLVMRSNLWASGYDVDGTDQTSLGQFSGRVQQTYKHSVPRFFVPEHGTMFTLALVRFPPTATKEIQYLNAKGALTYTDIAGDPVLYGNLPPREISMKDVFRSGDSSKKFKIAEGQWYRYAPSYVSPAYHLLEGFPFIQEPPSGDLQERVLIRHHDYDYAGIKSAIQGSNVPNPDEAVPSFVSGAMAKAGKGLPEGTLQAGTSAVSDKLLDLVGLGGKSAADKGKDTRDYLAAAFPELNAWERAGADASSAGMVDAGFENQKELTKMQLDNQREIAEMQNETQKEIAGIQSATSRQNTKDQVYAQNEMLAYQQKESTARVASIMENTNLSKQQQVSEIMRQMLTQAQTAGQYFTNDQIKEMTRKVSAEVDLVHQQTQNQRYGSSHIGATAKDISNVVTDAASGVVDIFHGIDKAVADTWNNFWKDGKADGIGSNLSRK